MYADIPIQRYIISFPAQRIGNCQTNMDLLSDYATTTTTNRQTERILTETLT